MNKSFFTIAAVLVLLCFAVADPGFSQAVTGSVSGSVVDQSVAVVRGAEVSLTSQANNHTIAKSSSNSGTFVFPELTPGYYDLRVSLAGFKTFIAHDIKVDVGKIYTITAILEVGEVSNIVTVSAGGAELIARGNAEITPTVSAKQIDELPLNGRDPMKLMELNAGFARRGEYIAVINGNRATFTNVSLDGVNVQNNVYRQLFSTTVSSLFATADQVSEFTMVTAAQGSESGFGSNQVNMVTPSGDNDFHGNVYWFHRNDALAANSFFNNKDGNEKNQLIRNQYGFSVSGPVIRDKLLFFTNFEGERLRSQASVDTTVLTPDMRDGLFTYTATSDDSIRQLNIFDAAGVDMDPYVIQLLDKVPTEINNFRVGDSKPNQLKNTAGYSFGQSRNTDHDRYKFRLDYILNDSHSFQGTYQALKSSVDGGEATFKKTNVFKYHTRGKYQDFFSTAWNWAISPTFLNEVRVGAFLKPAYWESEETFPDGFKIGFTAFTNPVYNGEPSGYHDNIWTFNNNASWQTGAHSLRFGFQSNIIRLYKFRSGNVPFYWLGLSVSKAQSIGLKESDFPGGISGAELNSANKLMATLAGILDYGVQNFTVADLNNPVFVAKPSEYNWQYDTYALYIRDNWKLTHNLMVNLGLRWEYSPNLKERDNRIIQVIPKPGQSMSEAMLDSNATYDILTGDLTNKDLNNLAPSVGFAWNVFGNSKTVLRGGYSISYVNDEAISSTTDWLNRFGIDETARLSNLTGIISGGLPTIPTPEFELPLSLTTIASTRDPSVKATYGIDPNLVIPYVQSWQFGIQRRVGAETAVEIRYVGTKGTKMKRTIDINQVEVFQNGFLEDFLRARSNGFLAEAQGLGFNPNYNPNIPGSQPLTIYPKLYGGGLLDNSGIRDIIKRGEVGQNAFLYQYNGLTGGFRFYPNPNANMSRMGVNQASSIYHGLQVEVRRRFRDGLSFNGNYTFSKVLTDAQGSSLYGVTYLEASVDINNPGYNRGRAAFDLTHAFKANFIYELPFGYGKRFDISHSIANQILGGWTITSIFTWQSGSPFSINSGRGTLNATSGSWNNRADSTLDGAGIKELFGITEDAKGDIYFIDPKVTYSDGRAVGDDGKPPFDGQVFFHPPPGALGGLPANGYNGPGFFNWDFSALKRFPITEEVDLEFRAEFFNFPNHNNFDFLGYALDANNFGQVTASKGNPRITQFALKINW